MGAFSSLATMGLDLALSQAARRQTDDSLAKQESRRAQQLLAASTEDRRQAELTLRRRLAEERARAGAGGVGGAGGSADAVLKGLEEESRALQAARDAETRSRLDTLDSTFGERRQRNLLDFSSRWLDAGTRSLLGSGGRRRSLLD